MTHSLVYLDTAEADLTAIYDWIADRADPVTAFDYVERLRAACDRLVTFPGRGTPRDDLGPGVRTIAFERRAVIAYQFDGDTVSIVQVLHRGRDIDGAFTKD